MTTPVARAIIATINELPTIHLGRFMCGPSIVKVSSCHLKGMSLGHRFSFHLFGDGASLQYSSLGHTFLTFVGKMSLKLGCPAPRLWIRVQDWMLREWDLVTKGFARPVVAHDGGLCHNTHRRL